MIHLHLIQLSPASFIEQETSRLALFLDKTKCIQILILFEKCLKIMVYPKKINEPLVYIGWVRIRSKMRIFSIDLNANPAIIMK